MLENPTIAGGASTDSTVKRYAPPNQRNRSLSRRKSAEQIDRSNNLYGNAVEKNQVHHTRSVPAADHGDGGSSNLVNKNPDPRLIALDRCCTSEASRLLNDRWTAAMHRYNDPTTNVSERPVMYLGNVGSAWGARLPHQLMAPASNSGHSGAQTDFLIELRHAMHTSSAGFDT